MHLTFGGKVTSPADTQTHTDPYRRMEAEFVCDGENAHIVRADASEGDKRGKRIVDHLRGRGDVLVSTGAIMALTGE